MNNNKLLFKELLIIFVVIFFCGKVGASTSKMESRIRYPSESPDEFIKGSVVNERGEPLAGVSVGVKGTSRGTITDENGSFSLEVEKGDVLVFNIIGYQSLEKKIENENEDANLKVELKEIAQGLDEIVVVGYGRQKKSSLTGAVDMVTNKEIENRPTPNVLSALQGTSPNLIIQQRNFEPGQAQNLNIRGIGTLGDNSPLVVIDGIPGGDINLINPDDIKSVSILKDAGAAAIYGSRSANGVILITTKQGERNQGPQVSYSGIIGTQVPNIMDQPVDAWENAYYKNLSLVNAGLDPAFTPQEIRAFKENGNGDWRLDNILKNALQQNHNISVQGGGAHSTYFFSLGLMDQRSNFVGPDYGYKRYNARLNQTSDLGRFHLNTVISYVKVKNRDHIGSTGNLIADGGRVPLYYNYQDSLGRYLTNPVSAELNPLGILEEGGHRSSDDDEISGRIEGSFDIYKDLKLVGLAGGVVRQNNSFERDIPITFFPGGASGKDSPVSEGNYKSLFSNVQMRAEYNKQFQKNTIDGLIGFSNESQKEESSNISEKFTDPVLGVPVTGTLIDPNGTSTSIQNTNETSINSIFGRARYNYDEKYYAEFDFRYDGSSKFAKDHRWGFFPSGSVAWRISQEPFFEQLKDYLPEFKLRASYGVLGNQNVSAYQYQTTFFSYTNAYGFGNQAVAGSGFNIGNPDLTWERASTLDFGADIGLFRNFQITFDYFDKITRDILAPRDDVPDMFGAGLPSFNIAEVQDRGWELKVSYDHKGRVFDHTIVANIADSRNKILRLSNGVDEYSPVQTEEYQLLRKVGEPVTVYYGFRTRGLFQNEQQVEDAENYPRFANSVVGPGDLMFVDKNGDGVINDDDKFILGNPFPRYTFGISYGLVWRFLDLQVLGQGVGKRAQMLRGEQVEPFHVGYGGTMYKHQTDFWTPTNPDARWPRLAENGSPANTNNFRHGSDLNLFNAAYFRLKNLEVGFTIPSRLSEKAGIQKMRIYFTTQNLFTITRMNFLDPEITEFNNNTDMNAGANSSRAYFLPKFYGGGINITFK